MYYADRFRDALGNGGRALFVGIGREQLPQEYRDDARLICWGSDSPQSTSQMFVDLPVRTRVVVATKFCSHATYNKVARAAKRSGALVFGQLSGTGEIAKMIREALPKDDAAPKILTPPPAPPPAATPPSTVAASATPRTPPASFRTITECVRWYAPEEIARPVRDGQVKASPLPDAFYEALAAKVSSHGFATDKNRVRALFHNARMVHFRHAKGDEQPRVSPASPETVPPAAPPPAVTAAPAEPLPPDLDALVHMADDLDFRGMQAVELADQLRRLVGEQRDLRAIKQRYDQLVAILSHTNGNGNGNGHANG